MQIHYYYKWSRDKSMKGKPCWNDIMARVKCIHHSSNLSLTMFWPSKLVEIIQQEFFSNQLFTIPNIMLLDDNQSIHIQKSDSNRVLLLVIIGKINRNDSACMLFVFKLNQVILLIELCYKFRFFWIDQIGKERTIHSF